MSGLTTTDLGQAGAVIEAEEARKVIEGRDATIERLRHAVVLAMGHIEGAPFDPDDAEVLRFLDDALGGKP